MSIDTATGKEAPAEISSERVKDIFSSIAKKYERFNAVSSFGAYKAWLSGMMRQAPIKETDDVLDIAGGTGDVSFTVARTKRPAHIQCTDLVDEMLDVARAHVELEGKNCGVPMWSALYNIYLKHLIPFWGGLITGDKSGFVYLAKSIKAFPNQQGLAHLMENAGFVDVTWKNYAGGIAAVHVAHKPKA